MTAESLPSSTFRKGIRGNRFRQWELIYLALNGNIGLPINIKVIIENDHRSYSCEVPVEKEIILSVSKWARVR